MLRLAIIVPTYNEVNNVQTLVASIADAGRLCVDTDVTVVIIDDSSPDGTAAAVEKLAPSLVTDSFRIRTIVKPEKRGLGAAYVYGFERIAADEFDYVLQMDADLSHDPKYIPEFVARAKAGIELVVASRYIQGGGTPDWAFNRRFLSRGGNFYARTVLSPRITDWTGGFNMYSAALLKRITPATITADGYGFMLALKYRALRAATSIGEIPIVFLDRTMGTSKMPSNTLIRNFVLALKLRLRREE